MTFGAGTLKSGSTGDGVIELQQWLVDRGFLIAYATPTGTFDEATRHAVRAFQYSAGIDVDGAVGDGTRTAADAFAGTALSTGWHATAIRNVQTDRHGGSFTTETRRGVLHSTEGTSLPSYPSPPHFTIGRNGSGSPVGLWQHYPVTVAAKALEHPSGTPQTNRHGAIQVEIIGSAANMSSLATADPDLFQALGQWMRWVEATTGVAQVSNHAFDGVAAYGRDGSVRLTDAQWDASTGWVGHQHVPNNSHWDPGQIDIAGLLAIPAAGSTGSSTTPVTQALWGAGDTVTFAEVDHGGAAAVGPRPTIRATTHRLTNAFPSLSFAVDAGASAYFEVMMATDRTLFAPEQAARRSPDNFHASRSEGLRSVGRSRGRYVAPVDVIQRFAAANPNGAQIWYTVVAYSDEAGANPVPAADPADLARTAPSVAMMPGFRGHTLTETLGVPLSMLHPAARELALAGHRTGILAMARAGSLSSEAPPGAAPSRNESNDSASDRLEGEDGYDVARQRVQSPVAPAPVVPDVERPPQPGSNGQGQVGAQIPYDDGFGSWAATGAALSSTYPAGDSQPRALYDSEATYLADDDEFDDLGWVGSAYASGESTNGGTPSGNGAQPAAGGNGSQRRLTPAWRRMAPVLTPAEKRDVIEAFVGDDVDLYALVDADSAYSGGAGSDHPANGRYHVGLSYGIAAFSQDSGALGQLLTLMQERDSEQFALTFGEHAAELVATLNKPGPLGRDTPDGRSVRVQPVAGVDVWDEPWRSRFVAAGQHRPFRGAQIELAAGMFLDPVMQFATDLGLATERGLAMIFDRAAHRGAVGGMNWVIETVGPFQSPMLLRDALTALGFADVEGFQRSQPDLLVDDQFGPLTHAALTAAARAANVGAPPIMDYRQMLTALAARATGQPWGDRIVRLAGATLDDAPYGAGIAA